MTEGKWSVFGASEEEQMVEEALHAADAGNAGHWPTVAGILAVEVRRLRRIVNGYDRTPAEARAKAAAEERDEYRRKYEHYRDNENALLRSVEAERDRLKSALEKIEGKLRNLSDEAHEERLI